MSSRSEIHVGVAQIGISLGDVDANLDKHLTYIARGRESGLDLLVFPELSLTGYRLGSRVPEVAMARDDARLRRLAEAAGDMQVAVGLVEEAGPGEYYNALALLRGGTLLAVHRKLNLPSYGGLEEGKLFGHGCRLTDVETAPGWPTTYLICADLWNPGLVHAAMLGRPCLLAVPANSASGIVSGVFSNERNWTISLSFYAMTYGTPVVFANRCGSEGETAFWGGSRILDPRGETLSAADDEEMLIRTRLSLESIARARFELPTLRDADTPLVRTLLDTRER